MTSWSALTQHAQRAHHAQRVTFAVWVQQERVHDIMEEAYPAQRAQHAQHAERVHCVTLAV